MVYKRENENEKVNTNDYLDFDSILAHTNKAHKLKLYLWTRNFWRINAHIPVPVCNSVSFECFEAATKSVQRNHSVFDIHPEGISFSLCLVSVHWQHKEIQLLL